jgi:hypothetical protein
MTESTKAPTASRRHALKLLGAAPMLPLGGVAFLTACGGGGGGGQAFPPIVLPPAPPPAAARTGPGRQLRLGRVQQHGRTVARGRRRHGHHHGRLHAQGVVRQRQLHRIQAGLPALLPDRRHGVRRQGRQGARGRLRRHPEQADRRCLGGRQGAPVLLGRTRRQLAAEPAQRERARRQGQAGVRRRPVRIHDQEPEGRQHLRPAALADRRAHARPGPGHRQAQPGEVPQRGHVQRPRPVDHLRREPLALGHAPVERRVRARCLHRLDQRAVQGLQQERVRQRDHGQAPTTTATCPKSP